MADTKSKQSESGADDGAEELVISPREGLQERLRKARERRKRRSSGDVIPGGEAIPETVMAEVPHSQAHRERTGAARGGDGDKAAQQDIEDVKASLAKKRALLQQQRIQRRQQAEKMVARRQSGQIGSSMQMEPLVSPTESDEARRRLFDEHDDDDDDDAYAYGRSGGKDDGLRVIFVAPDRSPAMPLPDIRCCGRALSAPTVSDGRDVALNGENADRTADLQPVPVLTRALANISVSRYWGARGNLEEVKRRHSLETAATAGGHDSEGQRTSGTELVRRLWVAARRDDEQERLVKEDEGLAVKKLPKAAPELMRRGNFQDRLLRDAVFARAEGEERTAWQHLQDTSRENGDIASVMKSEHMFGETRASREHLAPSATVANHGRGPSQAADFFSARGAPTILKDPLEALPMRVERPPADEQPVPPTYLGASVRQPIAGIGPEARLAGLDERAELRIIVPRVAFHDHPLFGNEDRLSASLRTLFGRYRTKVGAETELYLRRRLFASLSELRSLRAHADDAPPSSSATSTASSKVRRVVTSAGIVIPKKIRERLGWLFRDALSTLASILAEQEEVARLERAMNVLWRDLEDDRNKRGCSCTATRLVAREVEPPLSEDDSAGLCTSSEDPENAHGDVYAADRAFKRPESAVVHCQEHLDELEDFSKWLNSLDAARALRSAATTPAGASSSVTHRNRMSAADDRRVQQERRRTESVIEQCRASLTSRKRARTGANAVDGSEGNEGPFVLRLSNEGVITSDAGCGATERTRREKTRALRFRVSVFVNGSKVSTTRAVPLEWPEFVCSFNHMVRLRLVRRPESVMVSILSCSGVPWWPDQVIASVWVPVPGGQDSHSGDGDGTGPQSTHAFAPRTQWSQFASERPMAISGPLMERRTCGSVLVGTEWATSRDAGVDKSEGGRIVEWGDSSTPTLPVRGAGHSTRRFSFGEILQSLWTAEGRSKLKVKPLQGQRWLPTGFMGSRGAGGDEGGVTQDDAKRSIPEFARELDFLRLLPRGADVDPNDPRFGNVVLLRQLLASLGPGRHDSPFREHHTGCGSRTGPASLLGEITEHGGAATRGEEGEDNGVFRASQEQQVLVFAGRHPTVATGRGSSSGGGLGGGHGGVHSFAYNNHRRWKEPLRHNLIRLRAEKPALFGNRPIPFRDEDIRRDDMFMAILAQEAVARAHRHGSGGRRGSMTYADGDQDVELDSDKQKKRIAVDQGRVMDFVQRVRASRTAQARRQALKRVTYASVVQEEAVPQLGLNFGDSTFLPTPKRALRPEPKARAAATVQLDQCRLLLQIISARNVPVRASDDQRGTATSPVAAARQQQQQELQQRQTQQPLPGGGGDDNTLANDEDFEEERVIRQKGTLSSFVEVQFQDTRKRTNVYEGLTPLWEESLDMPFTPPMADFSPANLAQVNEMIIISLFDEVEFDDRSSGGYLDDESAIRREKHFLGSVVLPFQTVYRAGRVEGVLRLDVPPVNLGYDQIHAGGAGIDTTEGAFSTQEEEREQGEEKDAGVSLTRGDGDPASPAALVHKADRSTYIRVLATLDPIPLMLDKERVPGNNQESPGLVATGMRWVKEVTDTNKTPDCVLSVQLFVPDMFGNDILVTRYLCPQEPPPGLNTVSKCAHYVRLLPFLKDWQMFEGVDDMWCTSQQLMDILAGDDEEHAILLHNFILHLIMLKEGNAGANRRPPGRTGLRTEVYIAHGRAVPEGNTLYVMVQELTRFGEPRSTAIWKPATGEGFDARDARCPLVDIAYVASQENVWACLRRNVRPCDLSLNLADAKTWTPFFSNPSNPAPVQGYTSIQEDIKYEPTQQSFVYEVEDLVREALKRDIRTSRFTLLRNIVAPVFLRLSKYATTRRWRAKRSHTAFNADVSNRLAELLPLLEQQAFVGETRMGKDEHRRRLENTMRSRDLVGFPLHSGFVDVDHVVQMVKATGIHEARHPEVQFALAVQAFAYPNNVLSVWVYIASITPR